MQPTQHNWRLGAHFDAHHDGRARRNLGLDPGETRLDHSTSHQTPAGQETLQHRHQNVTRRRLNRG